MNATAIEWTTFSANPLKYRDSTGKAVWACVKCATECSHCYAETLAHRYKRGKAFTLANIDDVTPYVCDKELSKIITAKSVDKIRTAGSRVFLGDMTDMFGDWVPFELIDKIIAAIALRQDMLFQILTKRPARMAEYLNGLTFDRVEAACRELGYTNVIHGMKGIDFPLRNLHVGTSAGSQKTADELIPQLLAIKGYLPFLSAEPMVGPLDISRWMDCYWSGTNWSKTTSHVINPLRWVICGGESGDKARPMHPNWARSIRDQCQVAAVPFFFKQFGEYAPESALPPMQQGERRTFQVLRDDGTDQIFNANGTFTGESPNGTYVYRVGKKVAGRKLDGVVWNEFPNPKA